MVLRPGELRVDRRLPQNIKDFVSSQYYNLPQHIANSQNLAAYPGGVINFLFHAPANSQSAYAEGLELALQHTLTWLPWPFDGLGFNANATFMHSDAVLNAANTGTNFSLTGLVTAELHHLLRKGPGGRALRVQLPRHFPFRYGAH